MDDNAIIPEKRRKLKISHILIVLLLIAIGGFALYRWRLKSKLQARIDAIRAAGYPVTCAELDDWYSIPKNTENAAYVVLDAVSYHQAPNKPELLPVAGHAELPKRTEPLSEETMKLIEQYLADNQQALQLLHEAAAMEHSRYPIDLADGLDTSLPHLSAIRKGAKLLNLDAFLHAENGNSSLAAHSITSGFGIAHSLVKEPILVSQLVRLACQALAISALERALNRTELTDGQLVELGQAISDAKDNSAIAHAFAGERCLVLSILSKPESMDPEVEINWEPLPHPAVLQVHKFLGLLDKSVIVYIDFVNGHIKAAKSSEHKRLAAAENVENRFSAILESYSLLRLFVAAFPKVITKDLETTAILRAAQVGLAIERYRLAAGKLPEEIADLLPAYLDAVPKDPFDGEDLRYKRLERGFVIYSIGEDGSDDGGKERPPRSKRKEYPNWDITFIVER